MPDPAARPPAPPSAAPSAPDGAPSAPRPDAPHPDEASRAAAGAAAAPSARLSTRTVVLQGLLVLGGLVAFLFLLTEYGAALNPMIVAGAGAILLWPLRRQRPVRAILMAGGFVLGVWLLRTLGAVLAPFAVTYVLAFLLHPLVTIAERRWRVPRWASSLALTFAFLGAMAGVIFLVVPSLVGQIESLATRLIGLVADVPAWLAQADFLDAAEEAGLVERATLVDQLATFLPGQIEALAGQIPAAIGRVTRSVGTLLGLVTTLALVPVLLFYLLKDFPVIRDALIDLFPRYRGRRSYLHRVGDVVGNYLRGQLTISLASAVIVAVPLLLLGVPFALVLGLLAGVLNMVPSLGAILTYVLGILLMLAFGTWSDLAITVVVLVGQALIEQSVLTPNVMSHQVGLHPVLVLVAVFVFSALFGVVGLLIAVPATALLVRGYQTWRAEREEGHRETRRETSPPAPTPAMAD